MLIAETQGQLVYASDARAGAAYRCPACHSPVQWRHGQVKINHFAHLPGADCGVGEGETTEHLAGKQQLFEWLRAQGCQPRLEVYLPAIKQRPDLLLADRQEITAIEFQCSPLPLKRMLERNAGYRKLGIKPVWLLGQPYRHRLSRAKVAQFTQLSSGKPALFYWNTQRQRFECRTNYYRTSFVKGARRPKETIRKQTEALLRPGKLSAPNQRLLGRVWQRWQVPLAYCPLVCHDTSPSWPVTNEELLYWRLTVVAALADPVLFTSWPRDDWYQWLWHLGQPYWLTSACLPVSLPKTVMVALTADLMASGIIKEIGGQVVLVRHPVWFKNLADKYDALVDFPANGKL